MNVNLLNEFQKLLEEKKRDGFDWTSERLEAGTNIALQDIKKIRTGHMLPSFAEGLALLNLICGTYKRPKVRSIWPVLRQDISSGDTSPRLNNGIADDSRHTTTAHTVRRRSLPISNNP